MTSGSLMTQRVAHDGARPEIDPTSEANGTQDWPSPAGTLTRLCGQLCRPWRAPVPVWTPAPRLPDQFWSKALCQGGRVPPSNPTQSTENIQSSFSCCVFMSPLFPLDGRVWGILRCGSPMHSPKNTSHNGHLCYCLQGLCKLNLLRHVSSQQLSSDPFQR